MFNILISSTLAKAILHEILCFFIYLSRYFLLLEGTFFESLIPSMSILSSKITAAATTGPAKEPLPTSSTPAINV